MTTSVKKQPYLPSRKFEGQIISSLHIVLTHYSVAETGVLTMSILSLLTSHKLNPEILYFLNSM